MGQFLFVLVVLAVWSAIGHLIWVGCSTLIGLLSRHASGRAERAIPAEICPRCGEARAGGMGTAGCLLCNWPSQSLAPTWIGTKISRLHEERIERLTRAGLIAPELSDQFSEPIRSDVTEPPEATLSEPVWILPEEQGAALPSLPTSTPSNPRAEVEADLVRSIPDSRPKSPGWLALLAAFLERKNIRWGEIVGGLLIVGCSLALVISFWSDIAERPLLKFGLFNGITALLFALGFHAERRWLLPATALGLLVIATLLTPLNFLAVASMGRGVSSGSVWSIAGEVGSLALFAGLLWRAGRSLVTTSPAALAVGVIVPSMDLLLIRRLIGVGFGDAALLTLAALPPLGLMASFGALVWRDRGSQADQERVAVETLRLLAAITFAGALAIGLMIVQGGPPLPILRKLAPVTPLAGAAVLWPGLRLWRRTERPELIGFRTSGAAVAAAGILLMLSGIPLAWPDPQRVLAVALLDAVALTDLAILLEIPTAHALAGGCVSLAYLVAMASTGSVDRGLGEALLSSRSGALLVPLVLGYGIGAWFSLRRGRWFDAQALALVAGLAAIISIGLTAWHGFGAGGGGAWVFAIHALMVISAAYLFGQRPLFLRSSGKFEAAVLAWLASGLGLAAWIQALVFEARTTSLSLPWTTALLAHATTTLLAGSGLSIRRRIDSRSGEVLEPILIRSATGTAALAAVWLTAVMTGAPQESMAWQLAWLTALGVGLAWRLASPGLLASAQVSLIGSVYFAVDAMLAGQAWYRVSLHPRLDPWSVQSQVIALGFLGLGWLGLHRGVRLLARVDSNRSARRALILIDSSWPSPDRILRAVLVLAVVALAGYGVGPGLAQELSASPAGVRIVPTVDRFEIAGIAHIRALGVGSWAALGLVYLLLSLTSRTRDGGPERFGALIVLMASAPLLAGRWEVEVAVASMLCWAAPILMLGCSAEDWGRAGFASWRSDKVESPRIAPAWVIALGTAPLLAVAAYVMVSGLVGRSLVGPEPGTFFDRLGSAGTYSFPFALVAVALMGYAARERSSGFALAAGLTLNLGATVGFVLNQVESGTGLDLDFTARLALLNASMASASALCWIAAYEFVIKGKGSRGPAIDDGRLDVLLGSAVVLGLGVLSTGVATLWLNPYPVELHRSIAGPWGWSAVILTAGAVWGRTRWARARRTPIGEGLGLLAGAAFLAIGLVFRDIGGWLTYRGLLVSLSAATGTILLLPWQRSGLQLAVMPEPERAAAVRWAALGHVLVVMFALRALPNDPESPWWTVGGLLAMAPLATTLAVWTRRPRLLGVAAVLINLAASLIYFEQIAGRPRTLSDLIHVNTIALSLPVLIWLRLERRIDRLAASRSFGRDVSWLAVTALMLVVIAGLSDDAAGVPARSDPRLGWLALGSAVLAMGAGLWVPRGRGAVAGLYVLGLCAVGWTVHQFHLQPRMLVWTGTVVLAAFALGTSYLWSRRSGLRSLAARLKIPGPALDDPLAGLAWLVPANLTLAVLVSALAFGSILIEPEITRRTVASHAALAGALAVGLLARGERRGVLQIVALVLGTIGAVAWGWAWITPGSPTAPLDRLSALFVALMGSAALYGLGPAKLLPTAVEWTIAARRLVPILLGLASVSLAGLLGTEVLVWAQGRELLMTIPAIGGAAVAMLGAVGAALAAALLPGRDPLGLSERGRTAYVYGAEALLASLFVHLRLTVPWLFSDFFAEYAPLIVLGVAFAGVGLAEVFRRQRRLVLAEPLERTGAFLPVLPLLAALWSAPRPGEDVMFLVLLGGLYTTLSLMRSSIGFGSLAAMAFNGAIWVVLGRLPGFGLLEHPQLWVIPPALCVLAGAQWNRDRLTDAQAASVRYAAALTIYLASTADIFLTGVAQAPWLPLVLGGLAIMGIFAGVFLQVRGFLFLGFGFLSLALFTILWYAAVDLRQTWIWSASGILAGVFILLAFALLEKKREDFLRVVDRLRGWEP